MKKYANLAGLLALAPHRGGDEVVDTERHLDGGGEAIGGEARANSVLRNKKRKIGCERLRR